MQSFAREGDNHGCKKTEKEAEPTFCSQDKSIGPDGTHIQAGYFKKEQCQISSRKRLPRNNHALLDVTIQLIVKRGI